jgi:hypothetical protein
MIATVLFLYTNLPSQQIAVGNPLQAVQSVEQGMNHVYAASASYYSSILNVTGNYTFARQQALSLTQEGFDRLSVLYSLYGLSFNATPTEVRASWYSPRSYTYASGVVSFNLSAQGLSGITYNASQELSVDITSTSSCGIYKCSDVQVAEQGGVNDAALTSSNFYFYVFDGQTSIWVRASPSSQVVNYGNGTYAVPLPSSSSTSLYVLGVQDSRGITVIATNAHEITYSLTDSNPVNQNVIFEFLNNGTVTELGQCVVSCSSSSVSVPIPPVPVKDILVNETLSGHKSAYVPFQVEDWASNYTVPLGLSGNLTLFSNFQMVVTMVNPSDTQSVTISWNGTDSSRQTLYAIPDHVPGENGGTYFSHKLSSSSNDIYTNGMLSISVPQGGSTAGVVLTISEENNPLTVLGTVNIVRADGVTPDEGGGYAYTLVPGVVRDILQVEPENPSGWGKANNLYFQAVILIPADTQWIQVINRAYFVTAPYSRSVNDLMFSQLVPNCQPSCNGFNAFVQWGNNPIDNTNYFVGSGEYMSFDQSSINNTFHLWAAYCYGSGPTSGHTQATDPCTGGGTYNVGVLMMNAMLQNLYAFTNSLGAACGGGFGVSNQASQYVEVDPVIPATCTAGVGLSVLPSYTATLTWTGIFWFWPSGDQPLMDAYTLASLVEYPPTLTVTTS